MLSDFFQTFWLSEYHLIDGTVLKSLCKYLSVVALRYTMEVNYYRVEDAEVLN
jgi:hypothetical protein